MNYPCLKPTGGVLCQSHIGGVAQLAWTAGDTFLMSIGRWDHLLLQWRCSSAVTLSKKALASDGGIGEGMARSESNDHRIPSKSSKDCLQPWRSAIPKPTISVPQTETAVNDNMVLLHVSFAFYRFFHVRSFIRAN